jgi:hypothetical protein
LRGAESLRGAGSLRGGASLRGAGSLRGGGSLRGAGTFRGAGSWRVGGSTGAGCSDCVGGLERSGASTLREGAARLGDGSSLLSRRVGRTSAAGAVVPSFAGATLAGDRSSGEGIRYGRLPGGAGPDGSTSDGVSVAGVVGFR